MLPEVAIATKQPRKTSTKSTANPPRDLAVAIARLAGDMHCRDVAVLDVRHLSPVTDYFVLATGTSTTQLRATAYSAAEVGTDRDYKPLSLAGYEGESWIVVDFVHVVLHVFSEESRQYYDLDTLWGDAPTVPWEPKAKPARTAKTTKRPKATKPASPAKPTTKSGAPRAPRVKKSKEDTASSKSKKTDDQAPANASE